MMSSNICCCPAVSLTACISEIGQWYYDPIPESKAAKEGPLFKEQIPFYLNKFETIVKENGGYLVNGKVSGIQNFFVTSFYYFLSFYFGGLLQLTWADVYFVAPLKYFKFLAGKDFLEGYPSLQELVKKVESQAQIAAYIAKRPAGDR